MKKTLFSAIALVALMTACRENEVVVPRSAPAPIVAPAIVPTTDSEADVMPASADQRKQMPSATSATVSHNGEPGQTFQPTGRDGLGSSQPAHDTPNPGTPVPAVVPADTLAKVY